MMKTYRNAIRHASAFRLAIDRAFPATAMLDGDSGTGGKCYNVFPLSFVRGPRIYKSSDYRGA